MPSQIQLGRVSRDELSAKVASQIENLILAHDILPGDRLPSERELVEQLGVSRSVVREANKILRERGLVEVYTGRGTFVADRAAEKMEQSIGLVFQMQSNSYVHLFEVREALEPHIAHFAAERRKDQDVEKLRGIVLSLDGALESPDLYVGSDLDFHSTLARMTGNPMFVALISPIIDLLSEPLNLIFDVTDAPRRGQGGHKAILQCIEEGDPEGAGEQMRRHLAFSKQDLRTGMAKAGLSSRWLADGEAAAFNL